MKNLIIFIVGLILSNSLYSQDSICGQYLRILPNGNLELLVLNPDSTFLYSYHSSFNSSIPISNSEGHWNTDGNLLVLNSTNPNRLKVTEQYVRTMKHTFISILPASFPNKKRVYYNLHVLTINNDTLSFLQKTERQVSLNKKIKSFWIEDIETGVKSHEYTVLSEKTNNLSIIFFSELFFCGIEFNNEKWQIINNNKIRLEDGNSFLEKIFIGSDVSSNP